MISSARLYEISWSYWRAIRDFASAPMRAATSGFFREESQCLGKGLDVEKRNGDPGFVRHVIHDAAGALEADHRNSQCPGLQHHHRKRIFALRQREKKFRATISCECACADCISFALNASGATAG